MTITIRQEEPKDYAAVSRVIKTAFAREDMSNHDEQDLVKRLRQSEQFIPQLSLVAEVEGNVVGHILLSPVIIRNSEESFESLALAPLSVLPQFQRKGIGTKLIQEAHHRAKQLDYQSVVVLGHNEYYSKFGYQAADRFGITFPFDVPKENCMAIELMEGSLNDVRGMVEYPKEFYG